MWAEECVVFNVFFPYVKGKGWCLLKAKTCGQTGEYD